LSTSVPRAMLAIVLLATICTAMAAEDKRPRLRDLDVTIGVFEPGALNAITDVAGDDADVPGARPLLSRHVEDDQRN